MDWKRARRCIGIVCVSARSLIYAGNVPPHTAVFWPFINCESTKVCWGVTESLPSSKRKCALKEGTHQW